MNNEFFLIDSNSLITPYRSYYAFDFAKSFWSQMADHIAAGSIVILDMVESEILNGNDSLTAWMQSINICTRIDHRLPVIVNNYSHILQMIQNNPCYKHDALLEWSRNNVADPWLIATAAAMGYSIVTFEKPVVNLSVHSPSRRPKIPDIASSYNVMTRDLFYMMRALGFSL